MFFHCAEDGETHKDLLFIQGDDAYLKESKEEQKALLQSTSMYIGCVTL